MSTEGMSLLELLVVISLLALLSAVAVPRMVQARVAARVAGAQRSFAAAHSLARQVAAQYGRLAELHLDAPRNRFWIEADTSHRPATPAIDTIGPVVDVGARFAGVRVEGRRRTFCFDPRGLATARGDCDLPNATVVFYADGVADTLTTSRLGRLVRR